MLIDSHYHLDFLDAALRAPFLRSCEVRGVGVVAQTMTPSGFGMAVAGTASGLRVEPRWSLGFHPWTMTSPERVDAELAAFADAVGRTRFYGEIGLDFSPRRLKVAPSQLQVDALARLLRLVVAAADPDAHAVASIHTVRSAGVVLDLLDKLDATGVIVPVFHRFSGTSDDLTRLVRRDGYVSAHPTLLTSKRGRAYLRQVPPGRLLLETDLPAAPVVAGPAPNAQAEALATEMDASLRATLDGLVQLRGPGAVGELQGTQEALYGVP